MFGGIKLLVHSKVAISSSALNESMVKFDWRPNVSKLGSNSSKRIRSLDPLFNVRNHAVVNMLPPSPKVTSQKTVTFDAFSGEDTTAEPKFTAGGFVVI